MATDRQYGLQPHADYVASCTCGWSLLFMHEHTAKDVARAHRQAYPGVHETSVGPLALDSVALQEPTSTYSPLPEAIENLRVVLLVIGLGALDVAVRAMRRWKARP